MKFAVVDIETTGLAPEINEIIEIGAVLVETKGRSLKITKKFSQLVKPYNDIPPIITSITGIDDDMVAQAPRFQEVAEKLLKFVGDAVFVAHNVLFDLRMINIALRRYGFSEISNPSIDTQDLVAIAYPTMASHRLSDIIEVLDIKVAESHRALADAQATGEVLIQTLAKIKALPVEIIFQICKLLAVVDHPLKDILQETQEKQLAKLKPEELSKINNWQKLMVKKNKFKKSIYRKEPEEQVPIPPGIIDEYFSEAGLMREVFPAFEHRPQQNRLAKIILNCFNKNEHALLEAGTGTGKSAGYLLPAFLWLKQNGGPIIISTRTKNLQAQLMDKDIPAIQKLFKKEKFQILTIKGRQNYICLRRFGLLLQQMLLTKNRDVIQVLPIFTWLLETQDGDLSELHTSIEKKFGRRLSSEYHTCFGEKCSESKRCFLQYVRQQAKQADLIIANHSLVFVDLHGEAGLLPQYYQIILDEAHSVEDAVTEAFSISLNFSNLLDDFKILDQYLRFEDYHKYAEEVKTGLRELFLLLSGLAPRNFLEREEPKITLEDVRAKQNIWPQIELLATSCESSFEQYFAAVDDHLQGLKDEDIYGEVKSARFALGEKNKAVQNILHGQPNFTSWLRFTNAKEPYNLFLELAPVDIGEIMQENLFAVKKSAILTSATLTVNNNFDYFKQRFGIAENVERGYCFESVGSPFNYRQKMLVILPDDITAISLEKPSLIQVAEYLVNIFDIMKGRTLVLFTSYRMLEEVHKIVRPLAHDLGISILCQGQHGSRKALLSKFKNSRKTVLLGTSSFWEGVDVAGEALSCVVIVKLPFAVPTDPVYKERSQVLEDKGINPFYNYSVPQAVIKFKQGIGRLIRTQEDRGIVFILDERVYSKNYGQYFLRSLPDCELFKSTRSETLNKVREWF